MKAKNQRKATLESAVVSTCKPVGGPARGGRDGEPSGRKAGVGARLGAPGLSKADGPPHWGQSRAGAGLIDLLDEGAPPVREGLRDRGQGGPRLFLCLLPLTLPPGSSSASPG